MANTDVYINGELVCVVESEAKIIKFGSETGEAGDTDISRTLNIDFIEGRKPVVTSVLSPKKAERVEKKAAKAPTSGAQKPAKAAKKAAKSTAKKGA